jgi:hypothetical protein
MDDEKLQQIFKKRKKDWCSNAITIIMPNSDKQLIVPKPNKT